jgi:hypothetical protein
VDCYEECYHQPGEALADLKEQGIRVSELLPVYKKIQKRGRGEKVDLKRLEQIMQRQRDE